MHRSEVKVSGQNRVAMETALFGQGNFYCFQKSDVLVPRFYEQRNISQLHGSYFTLQGSQLELIRRHSFVQIITTVCKELHAGGNKIPLTR